MFQGLAESHGNQGLAAALSPHNPAGHNGEQRQQQGGGSGIPSQMPEPQGWERPEPGTRGIPVLEGATESWNDLGGP